MTLITELTETSTGNGEYYLGLLNANTDYYIELVFNVARVKVNFIIQ